MWRTFPDRRHRSTHCPVTVTVTAQPDMRRLATVFATQHGAISQSQLDQMGFSAARRRLRVSRGEWARACAGVYVLAAVPRTWDQRAMVATLCRGGPLALSHSSAARLHGLDGFERSQKIEISASRSQHPRVPQWVDLHRLRSLAPSDITAIRGIPVTTLETTLIHVAGLGRTARTAQALDAALRSGASASSIREAALERRQRGVSGPRELESLLADRVDKRLPRSWFQRLAKQMLKRSGVRFEDEYPVVDPVSGRLIAELDLANAELRVGVECQSWRYHGSPSDHVHDLSRKRRLRNLGWEIADVWWSDLHRPDEVVQDVMALIERQRKLRPGS